MATITTRSGKGSPLTNTELDANFTNLNTDKVEKSGDSMTGNLTFGDNDKAIFGAGSDLQIYHDGSNSRIDDTGTGALVLRGNDGVYLQKYTGEALLSAKADAEVELYYDNARKLETTSTGIDVTGTVTADEVSGQALRLDRVTSGNNIDINVYNPITTTGIITKIRTDGDGISNSYGALSFHTTRTPDTLTQRMRIDSQGDISFYEDTGTTAKFFWDASAESLGIGTTAFTGSSKFAVNAGTNQNILVRPGSAVTGSGVALDALNDAGTDVVDLTLRGTNLALFGAGSTPLKLYTNSTERMRIDSSGNVGIGTSSPNDGALHIHNNASNIHFTNSVTGSTSSDGLFFGLGGSATDAYFWNRESNSLRFGTSNTERMRIDSSGNLLVGKTSSSSNAAGFEARPDGLTVLARSGNRPLVVNRLTNDGELMLLQKDGTTVGSIGSSGGHLQFKGGTANVATFKSNGNATFYGEINNETDATYNLGWSGSRFKDLYLSGGVYLGGTGSANYLDDYEQGSWTPTIKGTTTTGSASYNTRNGSYVKIGDLCTVQAVIYATGFTGTGLFRVSGLPFTSFNGYTVESIGSCHVNINPWGSLDGHPMARIPTGYTEVTFRTIDTNSGGVYTECPCSSSTIEYLRLTITYRIS